ncbi:hypothetical protein EON65_13305, partial [archaeon]
MITSAELLGLPLCTDELRGFCEDSVLATQDRTTKGNKIPHDTPSTINKNDRAVNVGAEGGMFASKKICVPPPERECRNRQRNAFLTGTLTTRPSKDSLSNSIKMEALVLLASHGFIQDGAWGVGKVEDLGKKSFAIRLATLHDIEALTDLDAKCWGELSLPKDSILDRINTFKEGQWVAHIDDRIVGVMYTQRIPGKNSLELTQFRNQHELHTNNGSTLQLLGVAVLPEFGALQVSQSLRDFVVRLACLDDSIAHVVAMTRCSVKSPDESTYFMNVARVADPTLQFHVQGGAEILKVVRNYRPEDRVNYGHAVLISYNLNKQGSLEHHQSQLSTASELDGTEMFSMSQIVGILNELSHTKYSLSSDIEHRPFMDLGLDSLKIMEFRAKLLKLEYMDASR